MRCSGKRLASARTGRISENLPRSLETDLASRETSAAVSPCTRNPNRSCMFLKSTIHGAGSGSLASPYMRGWPHGGPRKGFIDERGRSRIAQGFGRCHTNGCLSTVALVRQVRTQASCSHAHAKSVWGRRATGVLEKTWRHLVGWRVVASVGSIVNILSSGLCT